MSRKYNDPSSFYHIQDTPQYDRAPYAEQVDQAIADAALFLIPVGGIVRGARAARWASHGALRARYTRGAQKGKVYWTDLRKDKFRRAPPSAASDVSQMFHKGRYAYSRSRAAVDRRLPLPRTRRYVDKWQGRAELVTNPSHYLTRKIAGRVVPGGMLTIGGVRYLISSLPSIGSGGPDEQPQPTAQRLGYQNTRTPTPVAKGRTFAPGTRKSSQPRGKRAPCPPGYYYSFKHRQCRKSKFHR